VLVARPDPRGRAMCTRYQQMPTRKPGWGHAIPRCPPRAQRKAGLATVLVSSEVHVVHTARATRSSPETKDQARGPDEVQHLQCHRRRRPSLRRNRGLRWSLGPMLGILLTARFASVNRPPRRPPPAVRESRGSVMCVRPIGATARPGRGLQVFTNGPPAPLGAPLIHPAVRGSDQAMDMRRNGQNIARDGDRLYSDHTA
jgi:hypothetical protein